jgi:hypothetical protein
MKSVVNPLFCFVKATESEVNMVSGINNRIMRVFKGLTTKLKGD